MEPLQLYQHIRTSNEREFGTERSRVVRLISQNLHSDPSDVLCELLQNAEDAESSEFGLRVTPDALLAWNNGQPFSDKDVRALCAIMSTSKAYRSAIGFFGIGFKSVFAWTDKPIVVSGVHRFEIRDYLDPYPADSVPAEVEELRKQGYTVFWLPLKRDSASLERVVERLGESSWVWARSLLFLDNVRSLKIDWADGSLHVRRKTLATGDSWVTSVLEGSSRTEGWLLHTRCVSPPADLIAALDEGLQPRFCRQQKVSLGFCLDPCQSGLVRPDEERLVYGYLPTQERTPGLGFLVQAPFLMALDRSRPKWDEPWNEWLLMQLGTLAAEVGDRLCQSHVRLVPSFLGVLPQWQEGYPPVLQGLVEALWGGLLDRPVVLVESGRLVRPEHARIPQSEVNKLVPRELLCRMQGNQALDWVAPEVWQVRQRRDALTKRLGVKEFGRDELVAGLKRITSKGERFFSLQHREWLLELYRFLHRHRVCREDLSGIPLLKTSRGMARPGQAVFFPPSEAAVQDLRVVVPHLTFLDRDLIKILDPADFKLLKDWGVCDLSPESLIDVCVKGLYPSDRASNVALVRALFSCWRNRKDYSFLYKLTTLKDKPILAARGGGLARPDECYLGSDYTGNGDLEAYFVTAGCKLTR